ncbi:hypothetical protein FPV67DRAFT_1655778 [Lyophyllum atratum]|nr:hypothetical protein FPV67DRAFT_1655778 [Lyophyllum atratum]
MIDPPSRKGVFGRLGQMFGLLLPSSSQYYKNGPSVLPSYCEWDDPELALGDDLTQMSPKSPCLYDTVYPREGSVASLDSSSDDMYERPPPLPKPKLKQAPIGTSRPTPSGHTRSSLRNAASTQPPTGSDHQRTYIRRRVTHVTESTSPPPLPLTSMLGRYQAAKRASRPRDTKRSVPTVPIHPQPDSRPIINVSDRQERFRTVELVGSGDDGVPGSSNSRSHSDYRPKSFTVKPPDPGYIARPLRTIPLPNVRPEPHSDFVSHHATVTPLHEEPLLFRALIDTERRYTQGLVSDDPVIYVPPRSTWGTAPHKSFRAPGTNPMDPRSPLKPTQPFRRTPGIPHIFKSHPVPISSHNPFRHPSRQVNIHPSTRAVPVGQGIPSHNHVFAPRPQLFNPEIVKNLERLVEDDEEIILYMASQRMVKSDPSPDLSTDGDDEPTERWSSRWAASRGVANPDPYAKEPWRTSPPKAHSGLPEGSGGVKPQIGLFDDFPVCEMSIAMGLHDDTPPTNVTIQANDVD